MVTLGIPMMVILFHSRRPRVRQTGRTGRWYLSPGRIVVAGNGGNTTRDQEECDASKRAGCKDQVEQLAVTR